MKFTGERFLPTLDWPIIALEHWHRYLCAAPLAANRHVLDVACGEGYGSFLLAGHAARVLGVDLDRETVLHASDTYRRDNLEFRQGGCASIPVAGRHVFDVVVSFETLEHLDAEAQESFLAEVKRVLRPDGVFLVSTPNRLLYSDEPGTTNPFHLRELSVGEFRAALRSRFRQVRLLGQKVYPVSCLWNLDADPPGCVEYGLERAGTGFRPSAAPKKVLYAIAVCSDADAAPLGNSILVDLSEMTLEGLNHALTQAGKTLGGKDARIRALEGALAAATLRGAALEADLRGRCEALEASLASRDARYERLRMLEAGLVWRAVRRALDGVDALFPERMPHGRWYRSVVGRGRRSPAVQVAELPPAPPAPAPPPQDEAAEVAALERLRFPREDAPRVTVLIPAFNQWRLTYACLRSVLENTHGVSYEVVLVDDCSSDATPDMLAGTSNVTVLRNEENQGFLRSCNRGLGRCRGDYVVFLNNDTEVTAGWLETLVETVERDQGVGAVGPKIVYPDGRLIEAGSIIWSDGSAVGYGRGADPSHPAFNYVKDVDFGSGACLLVRTELLARLGGLDARFAPAYYEDVDLCFGVRSLGYRVVYQPAATIVHHEGASGSSESITARILRNRGRFVEKWGTTLKRQPLRGGHTLLRARDARRGPRVVVFDDFVPAPHLGSGFGRTREILRCLAELGYVCTFFALSDPSPPGPQTRELEQRGIEVWAGPSARFDEFLAERRGHYDLALVSRPHNWGRLLDRLRSFFPNAWLVYDAEALYSTREILRRRIAGDPLDQSAQAAMVEEEVATMRRADAVIAVSAAERRRIEERGCSPVHVWGMPMPVRPPERTFDERKDLLFVGGFLAPGCPNEDAVLFFAREVFPLVRRELGCRFVIAGTNRLAAVEALASADIEVTGFVEDLRPLYERARLFVVPTRFAAGIPLKLHEALGHGLPAVVTPLIAEQMELAEGDGVLVGRDPQELAARIVAAYRDRGLWQRLQERGLAHIRRACAPERMKRSLDEAIRATMVDEDTLPEPVRRRFPVRGMPPPRSLLVRLDLTNTCNLSCVQCTLRHYRRAAGEAPGEMDLDLFARIAAQVFPYAASVALSCEAEPTLHSRFLDVLRIVGAHRGPTFKITTNAAALDDEKTQALLESGVAEIYVSVDGATPATYERIRRNGSFEQVRRAIAGINRWKAARGAGRHDAPLVQINYTLMHATLAELPLMVELCREWAVDRLIAQHVYGVDVSGLRGESLVDAPDEADETLRACADLCDRSGIRMLFPRPFGSTAAPAGAPDPSPDAPEALDCHAPWRMVRIRWTGDVHPCDLWRGRPVGNLGTSSFADVWNGTACQRLRWDHARRFPTHPSCRACECTTTENAEGRSVRSPVSFTAAKP